MPSCNKAKNPRGIEIIFTESDHKYRSVIDNKELIYVSGTQFLGKYYPQFDPTGEIAKRCAMKEGCTIEQIKAKWSAAGKLACELGTRLHETCEDVLLKQPFRNQARDDEEKNRFKHGIAMSQRIYEKCNILGVEKIVFSDRLKIAGTIDLLAQSKKDNTYLIIDHKTNKSIDRDNPYKKYCLDPISHVDDTNMMHYSLQLNLYQYLLKYESYVPKNAKFRMFLNHVTTEKAELIECPNMQSEIKDLMISYLVNVY